MPSLKHRLHRLDVLLPKPPEPPPEVQEHENRVDKLFALFRKLLLASWDQWTDDEQQAIIVAWDAYYTKAIGPLGQWLGSLEAGTSRLPRLALEAMAALVRAWLSSDVDHFRSAVCKQCGLLRPDKKTPPREEWKLLAGKVFGRGDPPYFDWPRFFETCPNCGEGWLEFVWPSNVITMELPWKKLDGYADRSRIGGPGTTRRRHREGWDGETICPTRFRPPCMAMTKRNTFRQNMLRPYYRRVKPVFRWDKRAESVPLCPTRTDPILGKWVRFRGERNPSKQFGNTPSSFGCIERLIARCFVALYAPCYRPNSTTGANDESPFPLCIVIDAFALSGHDHSGPRARQLERRARHADEAGQRITFGAEVDGNILTFQLNDRAFFGVSDEQGGRLRINDGRREGWASKSDFILVRDGPALFDKRVKADPNDTKALNMRAWAWRLNGEYAKALEDFSECIRRIPTDQATFNARGLVYWLKKEPAKAIRDFDEAIRLEPKNAYAHFNRGLARWDLDQHDRAFGDFDEAIRIDPQQADMYLERGMAHLSKNQFDKARADFDEVLRLDPGNADAINERGRVSLFEKKYDQAIKDFTETLKRDPTHKFAHFNRGVTWGEQKKYDLAIEDLSEAIRRDPKSKLAYAARGYAQRRAGHLDEAIRDCTQSIRIDPEYAQAYCDRGYAKMAKKDIESALQDFNEAVRIEPKSNSVHYDKACCLAVAGQTSAALDSLEKSLELGFRNFAHLKQDRDLDSLRNETHYRELLKKHEK